MEQKKIDRINELARKSKTVGLTAAEIAERAVLRQEYINSVVGNLKEQLDHTYVMDAQGKKHKLERKGE